jgi:ATP-binding cassette subfamily B protein
LASATDAELWLIAHYAGGLACAVLLARFAVLAAACALLVSVGQRELLRRSFAVPYAAEAQVVIAADRAAPYWRDVASGPAAARDLRVFGLASWAVGAYTAQEAASARSMTGMLARAVPRLWVTFVLMGVGAGVAFVVVGHSAAAGSLSIGELVVALGATLGVLRLGVLGEEAFPLEAAPPRLAALRSLEREVPL